MLVVYLGPVSNSWVVSVEISNWYFFPIYFELLKSQSRIPRDLISLQILGLLRYRKPTDFTLNVVILLTWLTTGIRYRHELWNQQCVETLHVFRRRRLFTFSFWTTLVGGRTWHFWLRAQKSVQQFCVHSWKLREI